MGGGYRSQTEMGRSVWDGMGCFNMIAYLNDNAVVKLDNLSAEI